MIPILRFVVFSDGDYLIAQCVERDICTQGLGLPQLKERLVDLVALEAQGDINLIAPAPAEFHEMWEAAGEGAEAIDLPGLLGRLIPSSDLLSPPQFDVLKALNVLPKDEWASAKRGGFSEASAKALVGRPHGLVQAFWCERPLYALTPIGRSLVVRLKAEGKL